MRGSWRVIYQDGTELSQWDAQHPLAVATEVPLRAIRWPEVATVVFESQWAGRAEFGFAGVPEGAQVKLRQRTMRSVGGSISMFMVCTERAGAPDPPAPEDTLSIFYWVPDGSYRPAPAMGPPAWGPGAEPHAPPARARRHHPGRLTQPRAGP
jgi:hypothetical protein